MPDKPQSPTDRIETLYRDLVAHYGSGDDRELRAAAKMLLVALVKFRAHGGARWSSLLDEYVDIAKHDPERLQRLLDANSGSSPNELLA